MDFQLDEDYIKSFRHRTSDQVRFEDVGAHGRAFETRCIFWIEWARSQYFSSIGLDLGALSLVEEYMHLIVHSEMDYYGIIHYLEDYEILTRTAKFGGSSMTLEHLLRRENGKLIAKMSVVLVFLDYKTRKPHPIPLKLKQLIMNYEKNIKHT